MNDALSTGRASDRGNFRREAVSKAGMIAFIRDIRHALRILRKSPGFATVAVLTLALGVGANASIYSLVDTLAFRMFPPLVRAPERIVWMFETTGSEVDLFREEVEPANFADWKDQAHTLEAITPLAVVDFTLAGGGEPERVKGQTVSSDYFKVMGIAVARGRAFTAEDERPGNEHVVILGDGFWKRRFGGDPNVLETSVSLDGRSYRVIGILPPDYNFPRKCNLLVPLALSPQDWQNRASGKFSAIARLAEGASLSDAHAELGVISRRLGELYPSTNRSLHVRLIPVEGMFVERGPLIALLAAVGFVLLIACANVANLELARGAERQRELAVRQALGATRRDVLRLLFAETLLVALAGGAIGIGLAYEGTKALLAYLPDQLISQLPWIAQMGLNRHVLVFTLAVTIVAAILSGLAPALRSSRIDLHDVLKEAAPNAGRGVRRQSLAGTLVVVQIALALSLLAGAGVTMQSFLALDRTSLGFRPEGVTGIQLPLDKDRYPDDAARSRHVDQLLPEIAALPGVLQVAASSDVPMLAGATPFRVEGHPLLPRAEWPTVHTYSVTPEFFSTAGILFHRGRLLERSDATGAAPVVVISDSMARTFFGEDNPIGQRIQIDWEEDEGRPAREIVGVVGALHEPRLQSHAAGDIYVPFSQSPSREVDLLIKGRPGDALADAARAAIRRNDASQVIEHVQTLDQVVIETRSGQRVLVSLLGIMAIMALVLASIGIYGLVSYSVNRRTREVGIRMALGAPRIAVLGLVLRRALVLTGAGVAAGCCVSVPLVQTLLGVLYLGSAARQTTPGAFSIWVPLVAVAVVLAAVSLLAGLLPARRATRVDPMVALRSE